MERIVKDPLTISLSRLREVEMYGDLDANHKLELAIVFAALPSVISLKARCLVEGPPGSAESTSDLAPHSSNVRDLTLDNCCVFANTLSKSIWSSRSLRSFLFSYHGRGTHPNFGWICAAPLSMYRPRSKSSLYAVPIAIQHWIELNAVSTATRTCES